MTKYIFTREELLQWFKDKTRNPRTNRKIKPYRDIYNSLEQQYSKLNIVEKKEIRIIERNIVPTISKIQNSDITITILSFLSLEDLNTMRLVCKDYNKIITSNQLWSTLLERDFNFRKSLKGIKSFEYVYKRFFYESLEITKDFGKDYKLNIPPILLKTALKTLCNYNYHKKTLLLLSYTFEYVLKKLMVGVNNLQNYKTSTIVKYLKKDKLFKDVIDLPSNYKISSMRKNTSSLFIMHVFDLGKNMSLHIFINFSLSICVINITLLFLEHIISKTNNVVMVRHEDVLNQLKKVIKDEKFFKEIKFK